MKKQILLVFLALMASVMMAVGQAVPGSAPRTLTGCADDPLHPIAGKPYVYQATATPDGGTYTWWATKDANFITTAAGVTSNNLATHLKSPTTTPAGNDLTATSANYAIGGTSDQVTITWSSTILANTTYQTDPTFVAMHYNADAAGCADNFRVFELDPKNGFTVDIRTMDEEAKTPNAYDESENQCIDDVRGATYAGGNISYNFGTNIFYYEVVAANFSEEWTPTFALTGTHAAQTYTIEWTDDLPNTWGAGTVWNPATTKVTTNETNTSSGVSIYVRVTVLNNNYEGTTPRTITLAVAGQNKDLQWDVNNADCSQPTSADQADDDDKADQILDPRPAINPVTTGAAPNSTIVPGNNQN